MNHPILRSARLILISSLGLCFSLHAAEISQTKPQNQSSQGFAQSSAISESTSPKAKEYMGRTLAQTMHYAGAKWLIRTQREREESAQEMLAQLDLKEGMVVCDLGCGNGYHTLPISESVGKNGTVFAVDIQPEMLDLLSARAFGKDYRNVRLVHGKEDDPNLPKQSCDLILMVDVYHEFSQPEAMLKKIHQSLKDQGQVVLVEYRAEDDQVPIRPDHKMSRDQMRKELEANGFKEVKAYKNLPWQHMVWFEKDSTIPKDSSNSTPKT